MLQIALTAAMQAFAAIALRDAIYVACPVSSGRRELELMATLSLFDRDELRREHPVRWRREVLEPNKTAAAAAVAAARDRYSHLSVINPSEFELDGLTQPDYDSLCADIIRRHVRCLILADGWQFSRGARLEAALAVELGREVESGDGLPLAADQLFDLMDDAVTSLAAAGFPSGIVQGLLPQLAPVS
jgi:hypothetical protein